MASIGRRVVRGIPLALLVGLISISVLYSQTAYAGVTRPTLQGLQDAVDSLQSQINNINAIGIIGGSTAPPTNLSATVTNYVPMFASRTCAAAQESQCEQTMPVAGTVSQFRIRLDLAPTGQYIFTVRKNGANTTVTCTITEASASNVCADLANSVSFDAGDRIAIQSAPSSTPGTRQMRWTAQFTPQ